MMRYEDASTWCLVNDVELSTDASPLGGDLLSLSAGGYKVTTVVPNDTWDEWRAALVFLVEQMRAALAA